MITIEESNELSRFIETELSELCSMHMEGSIDRSTNILEQVVLRCYSKYGSDININTILYYIYRIVNESAAYPMSYIFRNAVMFGCKSDGIYNNVSFISEDKFIEYITDMYYMFTVGDDDLSTEMTVTYIIMSIILNHLIYIYNNIEYIVDNECTRKTRYDFHDFKTICDVIANVYKHIQNNTMLYYIDQPDPSIIIDNTINKMFRYQSDEETLKFVKNAVNILADDLIIPIILYGYANVTDGIFDVLNNIGMVAIGKPVLQFDDMIDILDEFSGIYSSNDECHTISLILYEFINSARELIITVMNAIELNYTESDKMSTLKNVYCALYHNIIIPGLEGEWNYELS